MPVTGGPVQGIEEGLAPAISYYYAMSPDGKYVAYTANAPGGTRVNVLIKPTDSTEPVAILDIFPSRIFKWAAQGRTLLYQERQRGENPESKLFEVDPLDPKPKLLLSIEPESLLDLTYSRDGKKVAVVRGKTSSDAVMLTSGVRGN